MPTELPMTAPTVPLFGMGRNIVDLAPVATRVSKLDTPTDDEWQGHGWRRSVSHHAARPRPPAPLLCFRCVVEVAAHHILFEHRSGSRLSGHYSATGRADFAR